MSHRTCLAAALIAAAPLAAQQPRHPITVQDALSVRAVSDPQISPDGRTVLYTVRTADLKSNVLTARTYLVALSGGAPRQFPGPDMNATEARWSSDGRRVAFIAANQLWVAAVDGSGRHQLTRLNGGATGPVWALAADRIAFMSTVYPDCANDACNVAKAKAAATSKVKAHVADQLLYRHWNAWDDGTRSHLFVVATDGGAPRDLVPGVRYDVPPQPFGGSDAYAFSPDGKEVAFTAKNQGRADAWSTDLDIYTVATAGGPATAITAANLGADEHPLYTPDGKSIAYSSQARAGLESDRWRLMLYDRRAKISRELLPGWDRNADAFTFAPDMHAVYVGTTDAGRDRLVRFPLHDGKAGSPSVVLADHDNSAFSFTGTRQHVAWVRDAADRPGEVYTATLATEGTPATPVQLTHENDALVAQLAMNPLREFWFTGASGARVQGFLLEPPNRRPGKTYPAILLIHGGPQGAWLDQWHPRWNYQLFASPGYALVIINPRGSTGYGQKFVDEVSKDWGDKPYVDLMRGLDAALAANPWIDRTALGAAGGSFGGYMVDWIAGHTDRFKALVSHAGVYNLEAMAGATDELWFTDWEFGGPPSDPHALVGQYRKYSPHLFADNFKTPTLVLAGELDDRVPYTESLQFFTALQRHNVPSRLVVFPDEGHWITKPQNQVFWWNEVQGWLGRYLGR